MAILYVGPDRVFTTINSAYNMATAGDTIFIDPGFYEESILIDHKHVNLVGNATHPEDGLVVITGRPYYNNLDGKSCPIYIKYGTTAPEVTLYVENIKFISPVNYNNMRHIIGQEDPGTTHSNLSLVFNRCIFDGEYSAINSARLIQEMAWDGVERIKELTFKNCKLMWRAGYQLLENETASHINVSLDKCITTDDYDDVVATEPYYFVDVLEESFEKFGYGPKYGSTFTQEIPKNFHFYGTVDQKASPVEREIRVFNKNNYDYLGSTVSSGGLYTFDVTYDIPHTLICVDAPELPNFRSLIKSGAYPLRKINETAYKNTTGLYIENHSAETGDTTGWTMEESFVEVYSTSTTDGAWVFGRVNTSDDVQMSQRIDLISQGITTSGIDSGEYYVYLVCDRMTTFGINSDHYLGTRFFDDSSIEIASLDLHYEQSYINGNIWQRDLTHIRPLVSGTREIDIVFRSEHADDTIYNSYYDNFRLYLRIPTTSDEIIT